MFYSYNKSTGNQINLRRALLNSTNGKIFGLTFYKVNGEKRHMACRIGVKRFLKGTASIGRKLADSKHGNITVYDFNKKQYRTIKLASIVRFQFGKVSYSMPTINS